jgi:hypothetical protein
VQPVGHILGQRRTDRAAGLGLNRGRFCN